MKHEMGNNVTYNSSSVSESDSSSLFRLSSSDTTMMGPSVSGRSGNSSLRPRVNIENIQQIDFTLV